MSTIIRPEISKVNQYYISKHRYYELKHFCLQYKEWKKELLYLTPKFSQGVKLENGSHSDPTSLLAMHRLYYEYNINLVEQAAHDADPDLEYYILKAVTEELSYPTLACKYGIPCSKDYYYERYRRFFWILHKSK